MSWRAVPARDGVWDPKQHPDTKYGTGLQQALEEGTHRSQIQHQQRQRGDEPQRPNESRGSAKSQMCSLCLHMPIPHQIFANINPLQG